MSTSNTFKILFLCLLFTAPIFANAGTPFLWASAIHLVFLNALIGIFEGFQLLGLSKRGQNNMPGKWWVYGTAVCANYFSALIGYFTMTELGSKLKFTQIVGDDIWRGYSTFIPELTILMLFFTLISMFLEFPFYYLLLKRAKRSIRNGLLITLRVNIYSNLGVYLFYLLHRLIFL